MPLRTFSTFNYPNIKPEILSQNQIMEIDITSNKKMIEISPEVDAAVPDLSLNMTDILENIESENVSETVMHCIKT